MRISTKHATLIRDGIVKARKHTSLLGKIIHDPAKIDILVDVLDLTLGDIPKHPLSMRAYIDTTNKATDKLHNMKKSQVRGFHD